MNAKDVTICRLCLEEGVKKSMVPLIDESLVLTSTGEALSNFLDMKIKNDDNLPSKICKKCLVLLNQSIQFKQRCQTNYDTLKTWAKNLLKEGADEMHLENTLIQLAINNKNSETTAKEEYKNAIIAKLSAVVKVENPETKPIINPSIKTEDHIMPQINIELMKKLSKVKEKKKIDPSQKPFICEECGKSFREKKLLNSHLVSVHKNYTKCRVFGCRLCNYRSADKMSVVIHNRSHTGERPFVCEECGEAFFRKSVLQNHKKRHQEKTLACEHCEFKFHTISHLKAHINNVHIRQYLYECYVCQKTYARIGTVRKHLVKTHGVARESQTKVKRVLISPEFNNTSLR